MLLKEKIASLLELYSKVSKKNFNFFQEMKLKPNILEEYEKDVFLHF
jgi:hypothetical protein